MVATFINRSLIVTNLPRLSLLKRLLLPAPRFFRSQPISTLSFIPTSISKPTFPSPIQFSASSTTPPKPFKPFCTSSSSAVPLEPPAADPAPKTSNRNTLVNFSMSGDTDSESENENQKNVDKPKLPPPYDPFSKKPAIQEPEDPTNLQEVFHSIRSDGLMNSAVKMFDGLSQDGLTHEALELFAQIKDKGQMPEVVAHTAVMEAYVNAGQVKEGLKVFMRMLRYGVLPNAYTYGVLIRGLAASGDAKLVKEAKKYAVEMVEKWGMKPNAAVCVGVYEGLVKVGLAEEGKEVLELVKRKGVLPEEEKVREALKGKRGDVFRTVMSVFYGK